MAAEEHAIEQGRSRASRALSVVALRRSAGATMGEIAEVFIAASGMLAVLIIVLGMATTVRAIRALRRRAVGH